MRAGRRAAAAMPADSAARLVQRVFCHVMAPLPLRLVKSTFACEGMSGCAEKIGRLGRLVVVHECIVVVVKPSSDGGAYCQVVAGLNSFCMYVDCVVEQAAASCCCCCWSVVGGCCKLIAGCCCCCAVTICWRCCPRPGRHRWGCSCCRCCRCCTSRSRRRQQSQSRYCIWTNLNVLIISSFNFVRICIPYDRNKHNKDSLK